MTDPSDAEVLCFVEGAVGRIRLNRPKAIHALTLGMCETMVDALLSWRDDPAIALIMIDHAEGRGFCAGGDIRFLAESGAGDGRDAARFFFVEYRLNHLLFTYPKPVVAFMDGITMGGGVGISQPARYRVATERTAYAMPESGIGLFPDVGGGWYLSRLPGRTGTYLALTGARIDGADSLALGLATHYIPSAELERLKAALTSEPQRIEAILEEARTEPSPAAINAQQPQIDTLFASDQLEDILAALAADSSEWAQKQLATLRTKSPQTCKVSLRLLAESLRLDDFADEMRMEYRIAVRICRRHDFIEGVRALIIDKDNTPQWNPATPEGVTTDLVDQIFAPLSAGEEWTPLA
jgi:enoyl-CoA hydratase